ALMEKDNAKSLFQFVIAIEGMLQIQEKAFVTPSIVSQISESLAFIIEDDLEKRKAISKYFKDLYQKRSAIAHGGVKIIGKEDLKLALTICKQMIFSLTCIKPFNTFSNIQQLNDFLNDLKFK
ncbi:MAG: hypothetical protein ACTHJ5_14090, partial [Ilyomonas sp.]